MTGHKGSYNDKTLAKAILNGSSIMAAVYLGRWFHSTEWNHLEQNNAYVLDDGISTFISVILTRRHKL